MKKIPTITDRELEIMEVVWQKGKIPAQDIAAYFLQPEHGGTSKNTTYTFLNRLVKKGVLSRKEPGFICKPRVTREQVQRSIGQSFLDKVYHGSLSSMVAQFVNGNISQQEMEKLKEIIASHGKEES